MYYLVLAYGSGLFGKSIMGIYPTKKLAFNRIKELCGKNIHETFNGSLGGRGICCRATEVPEDGCEIELFTTSVDFSEYLQGDSEGDSEGDD